MAPARSERNSAPRAPAPRGHLWWVLSTRHLPGDCHRDLKIHPHGRYMAHESLETPAARQIAFRFGFAGRLRGLSGGFCPAGLRLGARSRPPDPRALPEPVARVVEVQRARPSRAVTTGDR